MIRLQAAQDTEEGIVSTMVVAIVKAKILTQILATIVTTVMGLEDVSSAKESALSDAKGNMAQKMVI